jgi:RNA polymerase sigma-70 factor (ECF subfamily)
MVYGFAYDMLRNPEDAEDVAQEVFINAFRAIGSFRGDARISTWLYRVTKNACLNFIRQRERTTITSLDEQEGNWEELIDFEDSMPTPEEMAMNKELRELVRSKIDELPPIYRTAIIMCDMHQLSYDEAARILGVPVGTLKSQVSRARRLLKEKLKSYFFEKHSNDNKGHGKLQ